MDNGDLRLNRASATWVMLVFSLIVYGAIAFVAWLVSPP